VVPSGNGVPDAQSRWKQIFCGEAGLSIATEDSVRDVGLQGAALNPTN
jgi:hypothetical protein